MRMHYIIGNTYLGREDPESMVQAAIHLNVAQEFAVGKDMRLDLARHNFEAAKFCNEKSAFLDAADLLRQGLALLDPVEKWEEHFDMTFGMTETLARAELINGNLDACRELGIEVLSHAKSADMKIAPLSLNVEVYMANFEMQEAFTAAIDGVRIVGATKFPQKVRLRHFISKLFKVKRLLWRKSDEDILSIPMNEEPKVMASIKMLLDAFWCGIGMHRDMPATLYAGLTTIELTLQHGLSKYSSHCITIYGIIELGFGRIQFGLPTRQAGVENGGSNRMQVY